MSDWWSRKMSGGEAPPRQQDSYPFVPTAPPRVPPDQVALPTVPQAFMPGAQQSQQPELDQEGEINMATAVRLWRGGEGTKKEVARCPGCGGPNFFSRSFDTNGMPRRGPTPAPECFDCGFPTVQSGSPMGGLSAMKAGGHARPAAQPAPPPPPPGSIVR